MVGCPTCGAALRFDIATQKMACDYCGGSFETQSLSDNSLRDEYEAGGATVKLDNELVLTAGDGQSVGVGVELNIEEAVRDD